MSNEHSDALVIYGVTGDLAFKKIFPALQAMVRRGPFDVPVIGVARSAWSLDQFRQRVHDSLEKYSGVDSAAFEKLSRADSNFKRGRAVYRCRIKSPYVYSTSANGPRQRK